MNGKPVLFISSTSDLEAEREALLAQLGTLYEPYLYEKDRARRGSPQERCREMIERSHVFVGLLGGSYGSPLPGEERSIVEWELDTARERGDLEVMAFVKKLPEGAPADPRQKRLLERVTAFDSGLWCKLFDSTEALIRLVRGSLEAWLVEFWARARRGEAREALRLHRLLLAVWAAVALVLAIVAASPLRERFSAASLVAACATLAVLVALSLLLLHVTTGGRDA